MDICALFQHIFEAYASPYRKLGQPSDMILQIIPSSLISSSLKQVLPRLKQYSNISKMVYGRCPRMESSDSAYTPGSMIQLAEPLPIIIDFKLNPDGSSHPLKGSETFHLAYACTNDQRWLNVALIDSFGSKQWNASYYLGECTEFIPTLAEIAKEIFDTVQDAANSRLNYSLVMVKTIKWTLSEIKIWKQLAQKSKVSLSMVVYDLECPLDLVDPGMAVDLKLLHEELPSALPILDTSSLDAGIVKTEEQDNFTRLVDTNNQAYWFPSKETLAVDNGSLTIQHHLASGYLMYRNMPLITIYVQDSTHATEMMSIVETYHHLKTLSQARCIDDNLPWHLAIADAARHGVEQNIHSSVVG